MAWMGRVLRDEVCVKLEQKANELPFVEVAICNVDKNARKVPA